MRDSVWKSKINGLVALICVGCVAMVAWLVIWQSAFGENPIANVMAAQLNAENQSY